MLITDRGTTLNFFWDLVNLLQVYYFLLLVNINLPSVLVGFLDYLGIANCSLGLFPNPLILLFKDELRDKPFNDVFEQRGTDGTIFVFLYGEQLFLWFILALVYLVLKILSRIFK